MKGEKRIDLSYSIQNFDSDKEIAVIRMLSDNVILIFFFKLVAFCTEFNLFTPICFVLFMIMDLPYICDHQVSYSAGGYSLSPRWFLT